MEELEKSAPTPFSYCPVLLLTMDPFLPISPNPRKWLLSTSINIG